MRAIVFVKATKSSEDGVMPTTELMEAMGKFNEELVNAGIMQSGDGLHPSSKGKRVIFDGDSRTVIRPRASTNPEMRWISRVDSDMSSGAGDLTVTP